MGIVLHIRRVQAEDDRAEKTAPTKLMTTKMVISIVLIKIVQKIRYAPEMADEQ